MENSTCVVISHYDQRPREDLLRLLEQLRSTDAGAPYDLVVSVNCDDIQSPCPLGLPLTTARVIYRPNGGYNMGSWDEAWRQFPNYRWYVFLQDECMVIKPHWLKTYVDRLANNPQLGILTESKIYYRTWRAYRKAGEAAYQHCRNLSQRLRTPMGRSATHAQTLILAMSGQTLKKLGGFILANGKLEAIATEVMLSRKAYALGMTVEQVALHPFEYVAHPQWSGMRTDSQRASWIVMRAINRLITRE